MFYSDDPVKDFERYDQEQAQRLAKLPECDYCGQPIQDEHYYLINGDNVCPECLDCNFKKAVEWDE
jgi:formylmethanofuran dehydrogenase subunit E